LNALKNYFGENLEIIGFPCNQFLLQEPGKNDEILNGLKWVRPGKGFVPKFPITQKIEVNGQNQFPLYSFLKRSCPSTKRGFSSRSKLYYDPLHERDIRWNWEKFLIHPFMGTPLRRYDASFKPDDMVNDIKRLLEEVGLRSRYQWVGYGSELAPGPK